MPTVVADGLERRLRAVDRRAIDLFRVLVEETEAENAECRGIRLQLLHDQVVVLAGFNERPVFTNRMANRAVAVTVGVFEFPDPGNLIAAAFHRQLHKRIPRT